MENKRLGKRETNQRRLILSLLNESEGHLDADELYRLAREREPRISLATVYRTLSLFKEEGIIEERHFIEGHHHYEVKGESDHYHLVCLKCGEIVEFESAAIGDMKDDVYRKTGFKVVGGDICLEGYCKRCRPGTT